MFTYQRRSCERSDRVRPNNTQAGARGNALASSLADGDWVAFESVEEIWIGRMVRREWSEQVSGDCKHQHTGTHRTIDGVRFDNGDFMLSVEWYERVVTEEEEEGDMVYQLCDPRPSPQLQNASELRHSRFHMELVAGSAANLTARRRSDEQQARYLRFERNRRWKLPRTVHSEIMQRCSRLM